MPLTVMPLVAPPDTLIADAPVKCVPVRVTFTDVPRKPELGLMLVRVAPTTVTTPVSTAPASILPSPSGLGRGFPKKSVGGTVT